MTALRNLPIGLVVRHGNYDYRIEYIDPRPNGRVRCSSDGKTFWFDGNIPIEFEDQKKSP